MCGIVAVSLKRGILSREDLNRAVLTLTHRGPDGHGLWIDETKQLGLGHTRLSIIGIQAGAQPLHRSDGRLHAIVNGEFYDYQSIRKSLSKKGYVFQTQSDSEILLALYTFYGLNCFKYLNGEFAFVMYDEEKRLLIAARDRFGVKPLFWANPQGNLFFASEGKALLALGLPARWNTDAIWRQLGRVPSQELSSCFQGVKAIKPAHYMLISTQNNKYEQQCYWDASFSMDTTCIARSDEDYIAEFDHLFSTAIKRRLQADVPVGCYLSGGIDSSAVAVIASEESSTPLTAFTVAFNESQTLNESYFASKVAVNSGLNHSLLSVSMKDIVTHYSDTVWHTEWPLQNGSLVAKYLLSKHARSQNCKVVITGEGSDELLAGYPHLWKDYLRFSLEEEKRTEDAYAIRETLRLNLECFKVHYTFDEILHSLYSRAFQKKVSGKSLPLLVLDEVNPDIRADNLFATSLYIGLKTTFPAFTLNVAGDRTEMAHSIEGRLPFLDIDLIQFLLSMPHSMRVRDGTEKYLLREAMKTRLPKAILTRKKHPFYAPSFHTGKKIAPSPIHNYMREVFHSSLLTDIPFLNQKAIISFFEETIYQPSDGLHQHKNQILHDLLSLCLLADRFKLTTIGHGR